MPRLKHKLYGFAVNVADGHALTRSNEYDSADAVAPADRLAGLKVDELKLYAEDHGIDLGEATKKADIVAAIEDAEAEQDGPDTDEDE